MRVISDLNGNSTTPTPTPTWPPNKSRKHHHIVCWKKSAYESRAHDTWKVSCEIFPPPPFPLPTPLPRDAGYFYYDMP